MLERDEKGRIQLGWIEYFIQALIILSLLSFSVETLPGLSERTYRILRIFELISVAIFSVEYIARLFLARPSRNYAFSFFGIIDLLAILPFILALGVDTRSVRIFRMLRLFRMFKLARYSAAVQRIQTAFRIAREELILFGITALMLLYLAASGIYYFESEAQPEAFGSIFHCLWWATVTLTTVGYGDVYPITAGGRIFTFFILIIGLGVVAVPTGLIASALAKARNVENQTRDIETVVTDKEVVRR